MTWLRMEELYETFKSVGQGSISYYSFVVLVLIFGVALAGFQYLFGEIWGSVALIVSSIFLSAFSAYFIAN